MPISSLNDLKQNELFIALNRQQSLFDSQDPVTLHDKFTRSPIHALQFLIAYAGLNDEQRAQVIQQLSNPAITKEKLDVLINDINWVDILKAVEGSTVSLKAELKFPNKQMFLDAIQTKSGLNLYEALTADDSIVSLGEDDKISFATIVSQDETWSSRFQYKQKEKGGAWHWKVPSFVLSPKLEQIIASLSPGESIDKGAFNIKKGNIQRIKLYIPAPTESEEFVINSKIVVHPGIYSAFIGLRAVYGLAQVGDVSVAIKSEAKFSVSGASATQKQSLLLTSQSARIKRPNDIPTIITIQKGALDVFFHGIDIVANFKEATVKADEFDPQLYIELITRSKEKTHVVLLAQAPKPADAYLLATHAGVSDRFFLKDRAPSPQPLGGALPRMFTHRPEKGNVPDGVVKAAAANPFG